MNKNLKIGLVIAAIVLVPFGTLALFLLIPKKKKNEEKVISDDTIKDVQKHDSVFPLKLGSKGDLVKELQKKLNSALWKLDPRPPVVPYYMGKQITSLVEDGDFGGRTLAVVKFYFRTEQVTESQYNTL